MTISVLGIDLDWDFIQIVSITSSLILWLCIYTPLLIYHSCKYYKNRSHIIYKARYANITIYEAVFIITKIIFDCFDNLFYALTNITKWSSLYAQLFDAGNRFLNYLVIWIWIWRIWMISYEIIYNNTLMEHEWKHVINTKYLSTHFNYKSAKSKWYITNRTTFGNHKWIKWLFFIFAVLSSIIDTFCNMYSVLYYSNNAYFLNIIQLIGLIPMAIPYIIIIIIYYITPFLIFFDNFYILTEIKLIIMCLLLDYFVADIGYSLFFIFYEPDPSTSSDIARIVIAVSFQVGVFSQFMALLFSTFWVNKVLLNIVDNKYYQQTSRRESTTTFSRYGINDIVDYDEQLLHINYHSKIQIKTADQMQYEINLKEIIFYDISLELFINHLFSEFCIQSILSLIEMLQFQKYCLLNDPMPKYYALSDIYIFNESIPKSQIVYNKDDDLTKKAYKLYCKYIKSGAQYKINLSYNVKTKLVDFMDNIFKIYISRNDLAYIFDDSCQEMICLINDSFDRFKETPQCRGLVQTFGHSMEVNHDNIISGIYGIQ